MPVRGGVSAYAFSGSLPDGLRAEVVSSTGFRMRSGGPLVGGRVRVSGVLERSGVWSGSLYGFYSYSALGGVLTSYRAVNLGCRFVVDAVLVAPEAVEHHCGARVGAERLGELRAAVVWRSNKKAPVGATDEYARERGIPDTPVFPDAWFAAHLGAVEADVRLWMYFDPKVGGMLDVTDTDGCEWSVAEMITRVWQHVPWEEDGLRRLRAAGGEGLALAERWGRMSESARESFRGELEREWKRWGGTERPSPERPVGAMCPIALTWDEGGMEDRGEVTELEETLNDRLRRECFWWVPVRGLYSWETTIQYYTSDDDRGRRVGEIAIYEGTEWIPTVADFAVVDRLYIG